jgi:protein-disulfide isomerase
MKPSHYLACALAIVAIAGCNSKQGDAATTAPAKAQQVTPPKGGDWSQIVRPTAAGGFVMGNPNAKVKLVEFGSMTCPHCREFDEKGAAPLISKYVKSGQVSWEFRNYVRDGFDVAASLVARCNGAKSFFPLTRALYKDQPNWVEKIQATPETQLTAMQDLPPNRQFVALAKVAGFTQFAAARGVQPAKSSQCLSNQRSVDQLVQMASDANSQFPDFPGTPTFIINGTMLEKTATWDALEPKLKAALGERG